MTSPHGKNLQSQPNVPADELTGQIDKRTRAARIESGGYASPVFATASEFIEQSLSRRAHVEPNARWNAPGSSLFPMAIQGYCLQATQHLRPRHATEPDTGTPGPHSLRREMIIYGNLLSRLAQLHAQVPGRHTTERPAPVMGFLLVPTWVKEFEIHQVDLTRAMDLTEGMHDLMSSSLRQVVEMRANYCGPANPFVDTAAAVHLAFVVPHHNGQGLATTVVCSLNEGGLSSCTVDSQPLGTLQAAQIALKLSWMLSTQAHVPCDPARLESFFDAARQGADHTGSGPASGQLVRTLTYADLRPMASDPFMEMALQILDLHETEVIARLVAREKTLVTRLAKESGVRAWALAYFRRHGVDLTHLARVARTKLAEINPSAAG